VAEDKFLDCAREGLKMRFRRNYSSPFEIHEEQRLEKTDVFVHLAQIGASARWHGNVDKVDY
jgi:hypothetical protein